MKIRIRFAAPFVACLWAAFACTPVAAVEPVHTLAEVGAHVSTTDCWTVVRGTVYNLTEWIALHPHGAADIEGMCGRDATSDFEGEHRSNEAAQAALVKYRIGVLPEAVPAATPSATPSSVAQTPRTPPKLVTCVHGKRVKKFALKKCPLGWKKR